MTIEYNPQTKEVLFSDNKHNFKIVKLRNNEVFADLFSDNNAAKAIEAIKELCKVAKFVGIFIYTNNPANIFKLTKEKFTRQ